MKDEEMAEEYVDRTRIVDENTRVGTDCISLVQDYEGNYIDIHERIKQAFLAGLKAGRPQWHKVKDGLPKESGKYLVCVGGVNGVFVIDFETEYNDFGYWCLEVASDSLGVTDTIFETITERNEDKVIAWCEIPTFDKEIE